MKELKVGDEIYVVDLFFRRCRVITGILGGLDVQPLDESYDEPSYRVSGYKNQAIETMIKQLEQLKE